MIELTYDRTLDLLEEVVAGNEDMIYEKPDNSRVCSYVAGKNTMGCGVGQVFRKAGVRILDLKRLDDIGGVSGVYYHGLTGKGIVKMDTSSRALLDAFQYRQDKGVPWGVALQEVKKEMGKFND
jgi:hypothetical protein